MSSRRHNTFNVFDQPIGVALTVTGETLKDLFAQSLAGLASALYNDCDSPGAIPIAIPIKISSIDINALMIDFLSEVLYESDLYKAVFPAMRVLRFTNSSLSAELIGRRIPQFDRSIRTVEYQGVRITRGSNNLWRTDIVFYG